MGRKKRNVATRSKAPTPASDPPPPLCSVGNDHGGDDDATSLTVEQDSSTTSSAVQEVQLNLENAASLAMESDVYSAVKVECEKALNALRRGNHKKALRLMKEMCAKHENTAYLALIHRVQGTVCVKVASIIDDPNAKQRHLKKAIESAKKAVMLSPNSVEFAHFYANLLFESATEGKDYEESVHECERALAIKNPIDPGKESLQDESQQKISSADARIGHVQNELRALLQKANLGSISSWMKNLGNGEEKFRIIPIRRVPDDPMDVRIVQARRPNDIKKANKTDEERKKEIEVKVAAARLLQQKLESSQTDGDKGSEPSPGLGQRMGERRKTGKVRKNASAAERKDCILPYWKSMGMDLKKDLLKIRISDIKAHFRSLKDGLAYEVISEALSFGVGKNGWRFWMCCRCSDKFADPQLHKQHIVHKHMDCLSPKLQAVLPPNVDGEWTKMLLTFPWNALDANAAVRMIELQSNSLDSNFVDRPYTQNTELANARFGDSYCADDAWDSSFGQKSHKDSCNGIIIEGSRKHVKAPDCLPMECNQSVVCKGYFKPDSWPSSNDIERTKLLEKIKALFQLLIKHKCLANSHLTKVIQFAVEELHPQLLNCNLDQSPICICFLGAPELRKVLTFLQELSHSCGVGRYSEKGNAVEELNSVKQVIEGDENIVFDEDGSSLLLDEHFLACKLSVTTHQDNPPGNAIAVANIGSENRLAHDDDSLLSWIFSGPTSREQLTLWTRAREEKVHQGIEILEMLGKEFSHLQSLCDRKLEHLSYEEALQLVEDLCLEEAKRREHAAEFVRQSYGSVLRKRLEELTEHDKEITCVDKFEVEALTNVLKEAESLNVNQFGFEETYGVVNSHVCDVEAGEDDWKTNDYLNQLDSCIEVAIQKQKEQLSVELSKIDARIMRNVSGMQQLEAKLGPLCAHDFGLIVVPLVKSYLRAHLENLAEKDATEKSDAAREAFLAELALDSKKGTRDIPKHLNDKLKDKKKNKEYRKTKDSKATSSGNLHVLSHENAEKASSTPLAIDGQLTEIVAEVGIASHPQEDEARRRKIELEAEERKLEATLEYQRRIEDEAKQKHLAELHKNNSKAIPINKVSVEISDVYIKHNIGNHVDDKKIPSRLGPTRQINGLLSSPEDASNKAKDGILERIGLLDGEIIEDGALLSDRRTGRRGRRQKNTTKVIDRRQQQVSSGMETTQFGEVAYNNHFQGESRDDETSRPSLWQAEEDDEKRFQDDLSKAVRQSLDAFHSHKKYPLISGIKPEDMLIEGEDSCVSSIEVTGENVIGSDVYGTGLKNEVGEYNCFLNVIIQSLWHLRRFKEEFLSTSTSAHLHVGDPCVTCALYDIFIALNMASMDMRVQAVAPSSLRIALSNLYPDSNFFQEAQMNDASEVLGVIFDCLHQSFTSGFGVSDIELVESNAMGSWECPNKACTAHSLFGMDIFERMNCYNCGLETRRLKYTSFFHQINANALRTMKAMCPESSFDELLNLVEMNHQLACDLEDGGCGKLNYIHHILSAPPHIFTTVLGWQNTCESVEDIRETLAALSTEIDLSVLYRGLDPRSRRRLVSVVCYYGQHYHCFAYSHVHQWWVMYDDKTVKVMGRWEEVVSMCEKGHLQPQVLFYEAVN